MPRFEVSCQIEYEIAFPSTLILNIYPQRNESQTVVDENLTMTPQIKVEEFTIPGTDSRFLRLATGSAKHLSISYSGTVDCEYQFFKAKEIDGTPLSKMDHGAIPYLFPSRYCQSDRLSRLAWDYFGKIENTYEKVMAITDWINKNVEYVSGSTNSETSAYDTVTQRTGVCRDFAHLGIAFCRALNIPARYFSGYAYQLQPPDFHACFEVYIGGKWLIFDATQLAHLNGLVRIGTGRDAADAALANIFGRVTCPMIKVDCQLAPNQKHTPLPIQQLKHQGVSLETGADN
jgi:transglutaminase-like putative cysteine protease